MLLPLLFDSVKNYLLAPRLNKCFLCLESDAAPSSDRITAAVCRADQLDGALAFFFLSLSFCL